MWPQGNHPRGVVLWRLVHKGARKSKVTELQLTLFGQEDVRWLPECVRDARPFGRRDTASWKDRPTWQQVLFPSPVAPSSFLLPVVRPGAPNSVRSLLVAMPFVTSSFLFLVVRGHGPMPDGACCGWSGFESRDSMIQPFIPPEEHKAAVFWAQVSSRDA